SRGLGDVYKRQGKTSLARDLGFEMALRGQRVLLVDVDPQANLSAWLGVVEVAEEETLLGLLEKNLEPQPRPILQNLDLIPAHVELARGELLLSHLAAQQPDILFRLRHTLEKQRGQYDLILVDSLPSLGSLAAVAGLAGDGLLIPVELSLKGLQALPTVFSIAHRYADSLRRMRLWSGGLFVRGIIPTGTDRTASGKHILEKLTELVASIGAPLAPSLVRRPAVYRAAQEAGMPVQTVSNEEVVAEYKALGDWFVQEVLKPLQRGQEGVLA
ncbi:MAG: ParA family protein, partial [Meiothermus sp.]|nr:ParA family protein [Meiothermus sp.]